MNDTIESPPASSPPQSLADTLRDKLAAAAFPQTLKELAKGLTRPRKVKVPEFEESLAKYLEDDLRGGRVFKYASGKAGADRYWSRDELHTLREAIEAAAAAPTSVADLVKLSGPFKTDKGFAEGVVRDLIGEDRLFEHPPKKKNGPPVFGTKKPVPPPPPPHPLEVGKAKKDFDKILLSAQKLLAAVKGVTGEEFLARLAAGLTTDEATPGEIKLTAGAVGVLGGSPPATEEPPTATDGAEIEQQILDLVQNVPSMLLSDLRSRMPENHRGPSFDAAVIRLAENYKVVVNTDADPRRFSEDEQKRFVHDADGHTYTTISKRS